MKKAGIIFCCGVLATPALALSQERDRSYDAGVNLNFARNWTVDARWERHRMDFAGGGENLDLWSAGLNYRF